MTDSRQAFAQTAESATALAESNHTPRVLVIEDHALVAESLSESVRAVGFDVQVLLASSINEFERQLSWDPDLALLDIDLGPVAGDGTALIEPLRKAGAKVVVLSAVRDPHALCRCYEAGASAVFDKARSFDSFVDVLHSVLAGGDPTASHRAELFARRRRVAEEDRRRLASFKTLTEREAEVLAELLEGASAAGIAEASGVSIWTVRVQIKHVLHKLGVNSQLGAVALARRCGWSHSSQARP